jgi:hypothetical protein
MSESAIILTKQLVRLHTDCPDLSQKRLAEICGTNTLRASKLLTKYYAAKQQDPSIRWSERPPVQVGFDNPEWVMTTFYTPEDGAVVGRRPNVNQK